MEVLAENGIKLTFVNLEEFESDMELKRAIKHFSESRTPYIEAVIDENESYSSVTVTVPEEWEKNCIFLFEELYEKLHNKGLELVRYSPPEYSVSGSSFKEVTFFLPFLYEDRIRIAKEIARLAHECMSNEVTEIAGEIRKADGMQYVVVRNSHEFWCNDYKGGDKIVEYCLKYRVPYIQLGLGFPYSKSTRARIDIYFLKEWLENNKDLPERIKKKLIEFVYSEPIETDIIAHSPPKWFMNHYGYRSDWWGITTPDFVIIPAVTTTQEKADEVAKAVAKIVADCIKETTF
ncbi:MAG TPA: hypothetical protein EYP30_06915 [Archaeoglobaceae archaeon]|nr:hypothetical protein [Archaeoglobaceae archaeon]